MSTNIPINIIWLKNETFENPLNIYQHTAYLPNFSNKSMKDILHYFIKEIEKYYPSLYTRKKIIYEDYKSEIISININDSILKNMKEIIELKKKSVEIIKYAIKYKKARQELHNILKNDLYYN